jgi:hypothetical protein
MASVTAARAETLVVDLRRIFGERLRSVVAYGTQSESAPLTCLVLVTSVDATDLDACARAVHGWHRQGLATPLVLPQQEFRRSLDAFPLEYSEMIRAHAHLFGPDPFDDVHISSEDLRRACETQVKSHLLHLREEYIEAGGRPQVIADLVQTSASAFAALLRNVARLHGVTSSDRADATREGARVASLHGDVIAAVLSLEHTDGLPATDAARLFPQYLAAVEQLAAFVDTWRAS